MTVIFIMEIVISRDRLYIETTPGDDTVMRQRGADASMMTSSNGNSFCVTGSLCGDFTGHRWIHRIKAGDAELWCFLRSAPEENGWVNKREAGHLKRTVDLGNNQQPRIYSMK